MSRSKPTPGTACPLCGANRWKQLADETERWLVPEPGQICECGGCRLRLVLPQPSFDENAANFEDEAYYRETVGTKHGFFRRRARLLQEIAPGKRLLDVGCACGDLLVVARELGFEVRGIELSEYAGNYAREQHGLPVDNTPLEEIPAGAFDVVHANHVLEHVHDPVAFASNLRRVLAPGGVCVVEVPNEFMNLMTLLNAAIGRPERRSSTSIHLFYFEPKTLAGVFRKAGFEEVRTSTWTPRLSLKKRKLPLAASVVRNGIRGLADATNRGDHLVCIGRNPGGARS